MSFLDDLFNFARSLFGTPTANLIELRLITIRLAIGGGVSDDMAIASAAWTLTNSAGLQVDSGSTPANGEIEILIASNETVVLNVFGTDYNVSLRPALPDVATLTGQQRRLDLLGYITGARRTPIGDDEPADGTNGPRTEQSALMFQCDELIKIDAVIGATTRARLTTRVNA